MRPSPDLESFLDLAARYPIVPVSVEVQGDRETAVGAFEKLVGAADGFLLESVEGGERWARWSFLGWDPLFTLVADRSGTRVEGADVPAAEGDPLAVLQALLAGLATPAPRESGLGDDPPPLHTGAVGYLGYDAVRWIERLPGRPPDDRDLPDMMWQFVGSLAAVDRFRDTIVLVRNVLVGDDPAADHAAAVGLLESAVATLGAARPYRVRPRPRFDRVPEARPNQSRETFEAAVRKAIAHIEAGDAFQIVPSIRFELPLRADPFDVYRALRLVNPSPFMFFLRRGGLAIAGSSPELMVRVRDGVAFSRPIAGTRRRGRTDAEDRALAEELLADPKERAEHVMLVDLARNDLGRICEYGSVFVDELMTVERYSHVMHLVSGVSGRLRSGVGPVDVLRATFPHGTVTGAPKVRAMQIIDELEPTARGPYAGAVGYLDLSGNLDTAIALRTMVSADERAWVQAGAGVVADSDPAREYRECVDKAAAVLAAIAAVEP